MGFRSLELKRIAKETVRAENWRTAGVFHCVNVWAGILSCKYYQIWGYGHLNVPFSVPLDSL